MHGDSPSMVAEGNNNMIHPTKLMRGAFLALAILGAATFAGPSIPLIGVAGVQAAEQLVGSVLFEGNRRFTDKQLLAMVDVSTSGLFSQQRLASDVESIRQAYDREGYLAVSVTTRRGARRRGRVSRAVGGRFSYSAAASSRGRRPRRGRRRGVFMGFRKEC